MTAAIQIEIKNKLNSMTVVELNTAVSIDTGHDELTETRISCQAKGVLIQTDWRIQIALFFGLPSRLVLIVFIKMSSPYHDGHSNDGHKPWRPQTMTMTATTTTVVMVCGRHCCGRHGLWPSWLWPSWSKLVAIMVCGRHCCGRHGQFCGRHGLWPSLSNPKMSTYQFCCLCKVHVVHKSKPLRFDIV